MLKRNAFLIILMIMINQAALAHTKRLSHHLELSLKSHSHKILTKPQRLLADSTNTTVQYKYEKSRPGLIIGSGVLLAITLASLIGTQFTGSETKDVLGGVAALSGVGAMLTYMTSNAKAKSSGRRKLGRLQQIKQAEGNYRMLMSTSGISELYKRIDKIVSKEDLSGLSVKRPKAMFSVVEKLARRNFKLKGAPLKKAMRMIKKLAGISAK